MGWLLTSPDQGAWYALSSLQRFQALIDLGAGATLATLVARTSDAPRLGGLIRYSVRWHLGAAVVWLALAGPLGAAWIVHALGAAWVAPWLALVVATCLAFPTTPLLLTLEARGRVAEVYRFRLLQGIRARALAWGLLAVGLGAWAQAAERLSVAVDAGWWLHRRAPELRDTIAVAAPVVFRDVWPYQWRIAAATVGGSLPHALLIPIAVARFDTIEGGKLGATFAIVGALHGLAWATLAPVWPRVGALLAEGRRAEAWSAVQRGVAPAVALQGTASALFVAAATLAPERVAERLTSPSVIALLAASLGLRLLREVYASWCRADLRPVTWPVDLAEGLVCAPVLAFAGHDLTGLGVAFLACSLLNVCGTLLVGRERR